MSTRVMTLQDAHLLALTSPTENFEYVNGAVQSTLAQVDLDALSIVPSLIVNKREELDTAFETSFRAAIAGYPHDEVETWIYQSDEAKDIVRGKGNPTPILDAIVAQTGEDINVLAASIMTKEAQYKAAIGMFVGKRHKLQNTLALIDPLSPTAEADIAAIVWA